MAPKPGYKLYEITTGPEAWYGWYYKPDEAVRGTGPFSNKEIARRAAELWVTATVMALKQKP